LTEKKVLIIKFGGLGDVILSLDSIFSIFKHHEARNIVLLTEKPYDDILKSCSWFDEIFVIKRTYFYYLDLLQIKTKFSKYKFSHVYDLQTSKRTSYYLKYFSEMKSITNGIGKFAKISHNNPKRNLMHTIQRQKEQLEKCNISFRREESFKWLEDNSVKVPKEKFALIIPGGSGNRKYKRIPLPVFKNVIEFLIYKKIKPIVIGGVDDNKICRLLSKHDNQVVNLCSKTSVGNLLLLSRHAHLSIGNDTGPMHLIARGDKKTIVLFTKYSNPSLCAPTGKKVEILKFDDDNEGFLIKIKKLIED